MQKPNAAAGAWQRVLTYRNRTANDTARGNNTALPPATPPPARRAAVRVLLVGSRQRWRERWCSGRCAGRHVSGSRRPRRRAPTPTPGRRAWRARSRGRGYCLAAPRPTRARISISAAATSTSGRAAGSAARATTRYVLAFALGEGRALAFKRDGAPCIASIRKLRLDSSDELVLTTSPSRRLDGARVRGSNSTSGSCALTSSRSPTPS